MKTLIGWIIHWRILIACRQKWKTIFHHNRHLLKESDARFNQDYQGFWGKYSGKKNVRQAQLLAQISGINDIKFLSEEVYYTQVEPALNRRLFAMAYADKNFYEHYLRGNEDLFPYACVRGMNGVWFDSNYNPITEEFEENCNHTELILKPSIDTSGGANVELVRRQMDGSWCINEESFASLRQLLEHKAGKSSHFVLQERIRQHPWFAAWNQSSLNTIRMMTYRSVVDNAVHPLGAVVRFGRPGSLVDNQAAGGLTCGVLKNGKTGSFVCDKMGRFKGEDSAWLSVMQSEVPMFKKMVEIAQDIASQYPYHRLLGFDFTVNDKEEVKLLEINCKNIEINFLQMNTGPLLGDFTEEILQHVQGQIKQSILEINLK